MQIHKYTKTASVKVADRPNMCYTFEKHVVRGPQKQCLTILFWTVFLQSQPGLRIFRALRFFLISGVQGFRGSFRCYKSFYTQCTFTSWVFGKQLNGLGTSWMGCERKNAVRFICRKQFYIEQFYSIRWTAWTLCMLLSKRDKCIFECSSKYPIFCGPCGAKFKILNYLKVFDKSFLKTLQGKLNNPKEIFSFHKYTFTRSFGARWAQNF